MYLACSAQEASRSLCGILWTTGRNTVHLVRSAHFFFLNGNDANLIVDRVHIKGILRQMNLANGNAELPDDKVGPLWYSVADARGKEVVKSTKIELKSSFCFDFDFELPGTINLGPAIVTIKVLKMAGESFTHTVDVQEYKRRGKHVIYLLVFNILCRI